ncbi:hypothetical protein [Candidatus Uabimicrobium sp. HlEnr_7]|uniref:hypothetical protein n=1 Tax=Candidatus Uabimicrobium helgolandensis TaxID=3095367 RepID=UPI003555EB83
MHNLKTVFICTLIFFFVGCSSSEEKYERISRQETALKEERKKIVNLQNAIEDAAKAHSNLKKRYEALESTRNENYSAGNPLGPNPPSVDDSYGDQLRQIKINYEEITTKIEELFEERKRIVEEQYN